MICYTRNFEDVYLQRAFADIEQGVYVDVGACMPVLDSNTYGLYTRGWHGIAIEPNLDEALIQSWREARPMDLLLNQAVGNEMGDLTFHVFDADQMSSGSKATIAHWEQNGVISTSVKTVKQTTLDAIIDIQSDITDWHLHWHLLCIDVEGMEFEVLQGLDFAKYRPWLIVLEAVWPGCATPNHQAWEPHLLSNGYYLAYFDAVNRYYVSHEHQELLAHFQHPPNVWDGFKLYNELVLEYQLKIAQEEIAQLKAQLTETATA